MSEANNIQVQNRPPGSPFTIHDSPFTKKAKRIKSSPESPVRQTHNSQLTTQNSYTEATHTPFIPLPKHLQSDSPFGLIYPFESIAINHYFQLISMTDWLP